MKQPLLYNYTNTNQTKLPTTRTPFQTMTPEITDMQSIPIEFTKVPLRYDETQCSDHQAPTIPISVLRFHKNQTIFLNLVRFKVCNTQYRYPRSYHPNQKANHTTPKKGGKHQNHVSVSGKTSFTLVVTTLPFPFFLPQASSTTLKTFSLSTFSISFNSA